MSLLLLAIPAAASVSATTYKTSDDWNVEFPEYQGIEDHLTVYVPVIVLDDNEYLFDISSFNSTDHILFGYLEIMNQALTQFTPSNKPLFKENPFILVTIRESVLFQRQIQTGVRPHIYTTNFGGGSMEDKGAAGNILYDGIFMANNIDHSCLIVDKLVQSKNGKHFYQRLTDLPIPGFEQDPVHFVKGNQLYWITSETPHGPLGAVQDYTYRQSIEIAVGAYLDEIEREKFHMKSNHQ
jgi:hypothetical protein